MASPTMTDFLMEQLSGSVMRQMSQQTGANEQALEQVVGMALPAILAALARNSMSPDGARSLSGALERDHDGRVLNDVPAYVQGGGDLADGAAILGHIFGRREMGQAEQTMGQTAGLDPQMVSQILSMLAPLVLGYLGKQQRQKQMSPRDLSDYLVEERTRVEKKPPPQLGGLAGMLDSDRDGDITDDAARIGMSMLEQWLSGRR